MGGKVTALARVVSHWYRKAKRASDLALLAEMVVRYAMIGSGKFCIVIAPTNCHWDPAPPAPEVGDPITSPKVAAKPVDAMVERLTKAKKTVVLSGLHALHKEGFLNWRDAYLQRLAHN